MMCDHDVHVVKSNENIGGIGKAMVVYKAYAIALYTQYFNTSIEMKGICNGPMFITFVGHFVVYLQECEI